MLIVCCGNADRGDDGAGPLVARRLGQLGVQALVTSGEASELLDAWEGHDEVVVVDAVVTGAAAGTVSTWEGRPTGLRPRAGLSSHGLGLAEALDLASALDRLPRCLRLYGIEGARFEPGAAPSWAVLTAVERVASRIARRLRPPRRRPAPLPAPGGAAPRHEGAPRRRGRA